MQSVHSEKIARVQSQTVVINECLAHLRAWVEERDYAGYEPYDVLNSPYLAGIWDRNKCVSASLIQLGKHFGAEIRKTLQVPESKNPKALGLFLAGYCDIARCDSPCIDQMAYLKSELNRLRSPNEKEFCWGYDWNFVSLRGSSIMRAFAPNSIATAFCANALLDAADLLGDDECERMAISACRFCVARLNRSYDSPEEVCFSYTPEDRTLIYNNSALIAALLARVGKRTGDLEYIQLAQRAMRFVCNRQRYDGAWPYGSGKMQGWIDGFHTGYNLCAISDYQHCTSDHTFDDALIRGYAFYKKQCFSHKGIPKYLDRRLYPIDIHACSQAILTFCQMVEEDSQAFERAIQVALWIINNMRSPSGHFFYQKHRLSTNRTPYMRWAQAWMFRALARLAVLVKGTNA